MMKNILKKDKLILHLSIATSMFLLLIYLNSTYFKSHVVLIGVFQEMLTIPCVLAQPVLFFVSLRAFYRTSYRVKLFFYSMIISLVTMILLGVAF